MNIPRRVLNAFTAKELRAITRLSIHMINYLAREGYLTPAYPDRGRARGKIRYYSYRDLLVARIVSKLLRSGIEIQRLKRSIQRLNEERTWFPENKKPFDLLATDGWKLYYHDRNGSLVELATSGQRSFSFVLDVTRTKDELKQQIHPTKRARFALENRPLIYADEADPKTRRRRQ